jgi:hypothetical protein
MEGSADGRGERAALGGRGTWFAQQLGDGWTEVEPGIYRFDPGAKDEAALGSSQAESDLEGDLLEALKPAEGEPEPPQPTRRLFGRRART